MNRAIPILALSMLLLAASSPAQRRTPASRVAAVEQPAAWLPLSTGNYWVYERRGDGFKTSYRMEVGEPETRGGRTYFRLQNPFGPDSLVRQAADGRFLAWNSDTGTEDLWYDFGAAAGETWNVDGRDCLEQGKIVERDVAAETPAGQFSNALKVALRGSCADAGSTDEIFAPGIGLVEHEEMTIAGPQRSQLREAHIDGTTISREAEGVSFDLTLDEPVYTPNLMPPVDRESATPVLRAVLRIENTSGQPLQLDFPSGKQFDAQILDSSGDILYTWSATRLFIQAATSIELDEGFKEFEVETPLGNPGSLEPWPAGRYVLRAWLPTTEEPRYEAQVPFEIAEPVY